MSSMKPVYSYDGAMPELPHVCHNCSAVGEWYAEGAHAWYKRLKKTVASPATHCGYWSRSKYAESIAVPAHRTLNSADFGEVTNLEG